VALDVALSGPDLGYEASVEVVGLAAGGGAVTDLDTEPWQPSAALDTPVLDPLGAIGVQGSLGGSRPPDVEVRLVPDDAPVPALLTSHLAAAADLGPGDTATVRVAGATVELVVDGLVEAVPGGLEEDAVLVDLAALGRHVLAHQPGPVLPGEIWLAVPDEADRGEVAAAAQELAGPEATVAVAGEGATDSTASVRQAFWIVAAGAAVLALTGVAAVVLALARERRSEVMVLRALGLPPSGQARARAAELLGVGVLGTLLGVLAGWSASALLVPTLARAAATRSSPLPLGGRLDLLPALGVLAVLAAGLVVVAAVLGARVRGQALDAEYREEVR